MKITPLEWEIIQHRLDIPEAIAECLSEYHACGEYPSYLESEVETAISHLEEMHTQNADFNLEKMTPCERAVFEDCLDGSTFCADLQDATASGEMTKGKMLSIYKAAASLEEKFKISIPR